MQIEDADRGYRWRTKVEDSARAQKEDGSDDGTRRAIAPRQDAKSKESKRCALREAEEGGRVREGRKSSRHGGTGTVGNKTRAKQGGVRSDDQRASEREVWLNHGAASENDDDS
eukprot:709760-Rhodomonas_salina.1